MYGYLQFGNNTYSRRIRRRSNIGHILREKKGASYGPGNTVSHSGWVIGEQLAEDLKGISRNLCY